MFTSDPVSCNSTDKEDAGLNVDLTLLDLTLTVTEVLDVLANFHASKATSPDEIPARILKETAHEIGLLHPYANYSTRLSEWASFPRTGNWPM